MLIYPDTVEVSIKPAGKAGTHCRFFYKESFAHTEAPEPIAVIVERTAGLMKTSLPSLLPGVRIRSGKEWVSILVPKLSRELAGGFLVGEFMPWSSVGNVPLKRLFEGAAMYEVTRRR